MIVKNTKPFSKTTVIIIFAALAAIITFFAVTAPLIEHNNQIIITTVEQNIIKALEVKGGNIMLDDCNEMELPTSQIKCDSMRIKPLEMEDGRVITTFHYYKGTTEVWFCIN